MGQLERFGLYVLCLVIFLILGVAIWGDGESPDSVRSAAPPGTGLKDEKNKNDDFEAMLERQNNYTLDKQRNAEELFKPVDADANRNDHRKRVAADTKNTPIVNPAPQPVALRTHIIKKGDNFESISKRYLGKRHLWHKILALNPGVDERYLKLGTSLKIPSREGIGAGPVAGTKRYLVRKGDSAWRIATKTYGESNAPKYSQLILELNGITDASALKPGTFIALPK